MKQYFKQKLIIRTIETLSGFNAQFIYLYVIIAEINGFNAQFIYLYVIIAEINSGDFRKLVQAFQNNIRKQITFKINNFF